MCLCERDCLPPTPLSDHPPSLLTGRVWLVGAGPGDAGLITVRGRALLERADVVVYDRLVGAELLTFTSPDAELIDVFKTPGQHTLPQDQIHDLLIERARAGKEVVRLKGGDPFVYGRGWEEIEACYLAGVPCEVVPGVSSAIGVPTGAGIPLTLRGQASTVSLVTPSVGKGLPADVVHDEGLRAPMVLVVGPGAGLPRLDVNAPAAGFGPLAGRHVVVTRPSSASRQVISKLRGLGAHVIDSPLIRIEYLEADLPGPRSDHDWMVFTSLHGVEGLVRQLERQGLDARFFGTARIAAVGPKTAACLEAVGVRADLIPGEYRARALVTPSTFTIRCYSRLTTPRWTRFGAEWMPSFCTAPRRRSRFIRPVWISTAYRSSVLDRQPLMRRVPRAYGFPEYPRSMATRG